MFIDSNFFTQRTKCSRWTLLSDKFRLRHRQGIFQAFRTGQTRYETNILVSLYHVPVEPNTNELQSESFNRRESHYRYRVSRECCVRVYITLFCLSSRSEMSVYDRPSSTIHPAVSFVWTFKPYPGQSTARRTHRSRRLTPRCHPSTSLFAPNRW